MIKIPMLNEFFDELNKIKLNFETKKDQSIKGWLLVEFTDKELDIKYRTDKKEEKLGKGGFGSVYKSYDL